MKVVQYLVVEAHDEADAVEFIDEALGEGDYPGYIVEAMNIDAIQEV